MSARGAFQWRRSVDLTSKGHFLSSRTTKCGRCGRKAYGNAPDEQSFEEASWKIIEGNFRRYEAYLEFAADYVLSYAENWCRENQIPFVETEELVDPPTHPYMFIDDVEDVLSYLKQGWSVEDYMNMLRQFNPDVEDFSAITPAIEAAVEQMKKDSGKQA